jgi:hypothetical protein
VAPPSGAPTPPASPGAPPQPAAAALGRLRFNPPQADVAANANFAVSLVLDNAVDASSAPIQITFDPKALRLNSVTPGDLMSSDGQPPVFSIHNEAGQATVQLNRPPGAPGVTAPSGGLVVLNFQAIGHGPTTVSAPNLSVRNSQGQVVASGNPTVTVNIK